MEQKSNALDFNTICICHLTDQCVSYKSCSTVERYTSNFHNCICLTWHCSVITWLIGPSRHAATISTLLWLLYCFLIICIWAIQLFCSSNWEHYRDAKRSHYWGVLYINHKLTYTRARNCSTSKFLLMTILLQFKKNNFNVAKYLFNLHNAVLESIVTTIF